MGMKNETGIRKVIRGGKPLLLLDFRYTDKDGVRRRYRRTATVQLRDPAIAEARRLMARAAQTGVVAAAENKPVKCLTFAAFVAGDFELLFMSKFREATQIRYRALLRQGLLDDLGELALDEVKATQYRAYAAKLQKRGVTIKGPINLIRTVLRAAVDVGALAEFPALPSLVKVSRKLPDAPTDEEVAGMLAYATGWLKTAIVLATYGGLRQGEVRGLEVRDVDLRGERLHLRRALSENAEVTPKSGHDRVVPLAPVLKAVLEEAVKSKLPKARLVVTADGRTPSRQGVLATFKAFLRKHGLKERSFHSLRHYFCTTLIRRGASVEAVRVLAGHASLQVTQRYVHAAAADLQSAIAKFGAP